MRIAYVSADGGVPVFGRKGCSVHVQAMLSAITRLGHRVELFTTRPGEEARPALLSGLPVHHLPLAPRRQDRPAVHTALAVNHAIRPALQERGPFDLVYERYSLWSYAAMDWAAREGIPSVLEVNAPLIDEQARHRGLADRPAAERVAARVFGCAAVLAAVSDEVGQYLVRFGAPAARIHVVPNAVDPARFARVKPAEPARRDDFTVGFLGTLKPWHGLPVLLEAFARLARWLPAARLLLVGDGPERERIETRALELGVADRVVLVGAVPPEAVPGWLAAMDCAVAPYEDLAGFYFSPLKVYEYMAAGIPVVASAVGQLRSLLTHGETALMVRPGDSADLAAALRRLAMEPRLRGRLGAAARAQVLRHHTWDAAASRVLALASAHPASGSLDPVVRP